LAKVFTTVVTVKMTPHELSELDRLVSSGKFDSRSSALRGGAYKLFEENGESLQTKIKIDDERQTSKPRFGMPKKQTIKKQELHKCKTKPVPMSATRRRKSSI